MAIHETTMRVFIAGRKKPIDYRMRVDIEESDSGNHEIRIRFQTDQPPQGLNRTIYDYTGRLNAFPKEG
jgi:hypothetical protein